MVWCTARPFWNPDCFAQKSSETFHVNSRRALVHQFCPKAAFQYPASTNAMRFRTGKGKTDAIQQVGRPADFCIPLLSKRCQCNHTHATNSLCVSMNKIKSPIYKPRTPYSARHHRRAFVLWRCVFGYANKYCRPRAICRILVYLQAKPDQRPCLVLQVQ